MTEEEIIHKALENLEKTLKIKGKWAKTGQKELDGQLTLNINKEHFRLNVEIKKELRAHMMQRILDYNAKHPPFMLVAGRLFPKMKGELRQNNVAYLEANGNFFLKTENLWFCIDTNPAIEIEEDNRNRAFNKTGLRVVYEFLQNKDLINHPYRNIAEQTLTAIGNITNIIKGLRQEGFILPVNKQDVVLVNKENLIRKWVEAYEYNLKPTLKIGTFRFVNDNDYLNWNTIPLREGKTWWGGEPAGDLLTNYLRPEELTLYTTEARAELMKNYRLAPDEDGKVKIYKKFWNTGELIPNVVPPLLAYADLLNTGNQRCIETAQKIYEQNIKHALH
jgi:hypothetical protein